MLFTVLLTPIRVFISVITEQGEVKYGKTLVLYLNRHTAQLAKGVLIHKDVRKTVSRRNVNFCTYTFTH